VTGRPPTGHRARPPRSPGECRGKLIQLDGPLMAFNALTQNQRRLQAGQSPRRQALLTYQTSGEVAADLANREVEGRFEGTGIAFGLGEQQATLQGGEGSQRELVDIGVVI